MVETLTNQVSCDKSATHKEKEKLVIVRGCHRLINADWSTVHAYAMQGYFCIRKGSDVFCHFADLDEGRA